MEQGKCCSKFICLDVASVAIFQKISLEDYELSFEQNAVLEGWTLIKLDRSMF